MCGIYYVVGKARILALNMVVLMLGMLAAPAAFPEQPGQSCALGVDVPNPEASLLVFSDHPERVKEYGLLCQGGLLPLRPVRFQFYHQGGLDTPLYLVLRLRNRGTQRALIAAVAGVGLGTADNYFQAGHQNNLEFLPKLLQGKGSSLTVGPGEEITVWSQDLPKEIVASGTMQWCLLQGGKIEYELYSCTSPEGPFYAHLLFNPKDVHARGIYPEAQRRRESTIDIGRWQSDKDQEFWSIGAARQPSAFSGPDLKGDYGVLYCWSLRLYNSSEENKKIEFALNPRGGKATGTFMAQHSGQWELWECPNELEAAKFYGLREVELPAHSEEHFVIYTIPEGASNYPVRLVVRRACQ